MKIFYLNSIYKYRLIRFIICSFLVTIIDCLIFFFMSIFFNLAISNLISYSIAVCAAFYLHKNFVFISKANPYISFLFMLFFSILGAVFSTIVIITYSHFIKNIVGVKILTIFTMTAYSFITKKTAFTSVSGYRRGADKGRRPC